MNNRIKQKWHGQAYCSPDGKSCQIEWENNLSMYEYDVSKTIDRLYGKKEETIAITFVSDDSDRVCVTSITQWCDMGGYPALRMPEWDDLPTGVTRLVASAIHNAIRAKEQAADEAAVASVEKTREHEADLALAESQRKKVVL